MDQILLVEDDTAMAESLIFALEAEQFVVRHARTLDQAEENCQGVDLILLDVSLPDGCGYDFCKRIRQKENCPVVFLTARDDEADIVHGLELGADDYITKPCPDPGADPPCQGQYAAAGYPHRHGTQAGTVPANQQRQSGDPGTDPKLSLGSAWGICG